jgi:hypothetical protein
MRQNVLECHQAFDHPPKAPVAGAKNPMQEEIELSPGSIGLKQRVERPLFTGRHSNFVRRIATPMILRQEAIRVLIRYLASRSNFLL